MTRRAALARLGTGVLIALVVAAQLLILLDADTTAMDLEEGVTPAHAHLLGWIPWWTFPRHVYRTFCGGCALTAVSTRGLFAVLGDAVATWKLALAPYVAAWVVGGTLAARRLGGSAAGAAHLVLVALAPPLLAAVAWRGWTNHFEATAVALLALAAVVRPDGPRHPALAGATAGLALVVSPTALITVLPVAWQVRRARPEGLGRFLAGASWAALPLGWLWLGSGRAVDDLRSIPIDDRGVDVVGQLAALLDPVRVEGALGLGPFAPLPGLLTGAALLTGLALAAATPGRGRLPAAAAGLWLLAYLLLPVRLGPAYPSTTFADRYLGPLLMHAVLATAVAVGRLGDTRRALAAALLVAATAGGAATLPGRLDRLDPTAAHLRVPSPSWTWFRRHEATRPVDDPGWTCPPGDLACAELLTYRHGARVARGAAPPTVEPTVAFAAGWGAGCAAAGCTSAAPVPAALRPPAEGERIAVVRGTGDGPVDDVASAWWAGQRLPRESHEAHAPPDGLSPAARAAFARGYGQAWALRWGSRPHPRPPAWTTELDADFDAGVADAHARPWLTVLPPGPP